MVASEVTVESKAYGSEQAYKWYSQGVDGYTITDCDKEDVGTKITLKIKEIPKKRSTTSICRTTSSV